MSSATVALSPTAAMPVNLFVLLFGNGSLAWFLGQLGQVCFRRTWFCLFHKKAFVFMGFWAFGTVYGE